MQRATENIRDIQNALSERTKNYEKNIPQQERQKIFDYGIALNVCQKFLEEGKAKEAVFSLIKYDASLKNLCSVVHPKNRILVQEAYQEFFSWAQSQNIFSN